ncbi:MAG: hypothetical protein ACYSUY_04175 [Planctomycetota bacterium]|jgi:hypothetical protein
MIEEYRQLIEEIMPGMQCSKKFKCAESGFDNLCKARDFWDENYLECLESYPHSCEYALPVANGYLCQCPLRIYLRKKLGK